MIPLTMKEVEELNFAFEPLIQHTNHDGSPITNGIKLHPTLSDFELIEPLHDPKSGLLSLCIHHRKSNLQIFSSGPMKSFTDARDVMRMFFSGGKSEQLNALETFVKRRRRPGSPLLFIGQSFGGYLSIEAAKKFDGLFIASNPAYYHAEKAEEKWHDQGINFLVSNDWLTAHTRPYLPGQKEYVEGTSGHNTADIWKQLGHRMIGIFLDQREGSDLKKLLLLG
ncbi:MAG TPA: hypothetical protein VM580_22080 [Labilithrix sp.]|nr:hypothetical protein [Labilithrix sp.]